MDGNNHTRRV